ncbi:MAG: tRNA (guanosine(37)-N1)-methyltransferase TrmD [Phycisphaerales bacterium]
MRIDVLTLFPEMFDSVLEISIPGRAQQAGLVELNAVDIRDYTEDKHRKVDDRPFGGGPGMVMMCQPIWDAVLATEALDPRPATRILMTPQGRPLDQVTVEHLAVRERLLIIAGRYEGIDERVIEKLEPLEISVGDFVVSGGELPALLLIDAVTRLVPGALGHEDSATEDSFSAVDSSGQRLLDCPQYTRPREWKGLTPPEVLMSGHHGEVERWRMEQRLRRTRERRPDLLRENEPTDRSRVRDESGNDEE